MDTIKFIIETPYDTHLAAKGVGVELYLNENKVPHDILNLPEVLAAHTFKFAEFDLYTCSCGVAGCAGFQAPVVQTKNNGVVTWTFPESNDYKTEKKTYEFDNEQFTAQFEELLANLLKLEEQNIYNTTVIPTNYGDDDSHTAVPQSIIKSFEWYGNRYQAEQNQREMLLEEFPDMVEKKLAFTYDGVQGKTSYEFASMIGSILNQFPRNTDESYYLAKCKAAGAAIQEALAGDNTRFYKIANNTYVKQEATAFWLIDWDFENVTEENFELDKLGIGYKND